MANKITRHIPNTITCCNLISGCIAIIAAIYGDLWLALLFIVIGSVFDFFDGMSARLLHVSAPIGKELDSLADVITFGLAPSVMLFQQLSVEEPFPFRLQFPSPRPQMDHRPMILRCILSGLFPFCPPAAYLDCFA